MRTILFLLIVMVVSQSGASAATITCADSPDQSYEQYLPPDYTPDRRWPVLYLLDPRGRGEFALDIYRSAAATYGYVIASSNNSQSDGPSGPTYESVQAMLDDTFLRLSVDPRRVYLGGMSGTARVACDIADRANGDITGVVLVGAACADAVKLESNSIFDVVAIVGRRDFNYIEVEKFADEALERGAAHRLLVHDGSHGWHDEAIASEVVAALELQAMSRGLIATDPEFVSHRLATARDEPAGETTLDSWKALSRIVRNFMSLGQDAALDEIRTEIRSLASSGRFRKDRRTCRKRQEAELREITHIQNTLARLRPATAARPTATEFGRRLRISSLLRTADRTPPTDASLQAERYLATIRAMTSFYYPRELEAAGDPHGVRLCEAITALLDAAPSESE